MTMTCHGVIGLHKHTRIYLRTATSFLKAWNCSGVGSVTFKIFTATSPSTKATVTARQR